MRTKIAAGCLLLVAACSTPELQDGTASAEPGLGTIEAALTGVPQDGYPNYNERMMLVAVNRARSDPNNPALGTAGQGCPTQCPVGSTGRSDCYTAVSAQKPLVFAHNGTRAARFHCMNLHKMGFYLSHTSPCTLRTDVGTTNCDGSQACACASNAHPNECSPSAWGGGTDPWARTSYFGYSASGEVGAAGQVDGWEAVADWVGECQNYQGHRMILTSASPTQIGCGFYKLSGPCWPSYSFCNPGGGTVTIPTLPAGVHRPETGGASTSFSFYVNYYSTTGAPQSVQLVLDGTCYPMQKEIGVNANSGTYKITRTLGDTSCHQYWFLARDGAGARAVWPQAGSWGVGSCTDYSSTAAPASCEGQDAGFPDAGATPDAAMPPDAATPGLDASGAGADAAIPPDAAVVPPDAALIPADAATLPPDAAMPPDAALTPPDAAVPPDAAMVPLDAATIAPDASVVILTDAALSPVDAAIAISDAASFADAAAVEVDAASVEADGGALPSDASSATVADASVPLAEDAAAPLPDATLDQFDAAVTVEDASAPVLADAAVQSPDAAPAADATSAALEPIAIQAGCGCATGSPANGFLFFGLGSVLLLRRRRRA